MNQQTKTILILVVVLVIAVGSIAYGALTPPPNATPAPQASETPKATNKPAVKVDLKEQLESERTIITNVLIGAYPKVATDYAISNEKLFEQGQWYGALLIYRGPDTANRDTLRVLMQKKDGIWALRTTPPRPLLSTKEFPDVPKSILVTLNKAISLP